MEGENTREFDLINSRYIGLKMASQTTAHVWGVIDFIPSAESNYPDWRKLSTLNSKDTTILLIPREDNRIRLYIELGTEVDVMDKGTGRVNKGLFPPSTLLKVCCICDFSLQLMRYNLTGFEDRGECIQTVHNDD